MKNTIIIILACAVAYTGTDSIFRKYFNNSKSLHVTFMRNLIKAFAVIVAVVTLLSTFKPFRYMEQTILLSSSLLAVVLGFAFQATLEDIIAGMIISACRPFDVGDRIVLRELDISGYVESITLRHTVIKCYNNSRLVIPNSRMNKAVLENSHLEEPESVGFLDAEITYESDMKKASEIMKKIISENERTIGDTPEFFVRSLNASGVSVRGMVRTKNIDENFRACSEIRERLLEEYPKNGVEFAYPHVELAQKASQNCSDRKKT